MEYPRVSSAFNSASISRRARRIIFDETRMSRQARSGGDQTPSTLFLFRRSNSSGVILMSGCALLRLSATVIRLAGSLSAWIRAEISCAIDVNADGLWYG